MFVCNQEIKSHEENRTANTPEKGKLKHQLLEKIKSDACLIAYLMIWRALLYKMSYK